MVYRKKNISRRICSTRKIKFRSIRKSRKRRKSSIRKSRKRRKSSIRKSRRRRKSSIRKSRKRRKSSIRKSRKRRKSPNKALIVYKSVLKSKRLTTPLTIYTAPGCPACTEVKELCKKKGIKFRVLNRRNHSKYVKKNTGNCRYVPNVFNFNKEYIGGNEDLTKLIKGIKNTVN